MGMSLCKRRGFVYQSGDLYGGFSGFWDYGPLGVELKQPAWSPRLTSNLPTSDNLPSNDGCMPLLVQQILSILWLLHDRSSVGSRIWVELH